MAGTLLGFEANRGQTDPRVKFLSRGPGYTLFLTSAEASWSFGASREGTRSSLRMRLVGSSPSAHVLGLDRLPGRSNYFIGNDPKRWRTAVPHYARVEYQNVYPGVNLRYHEGDGRLELDAVVAAGRDPGVIRLAFEGHEALGVDLKGNLEVRVAGGKMVLGLPTVYQENGRTRKPVDGRYAVLADGDVRFQVGAYDTRQALVIDPTFTYFDWGATNGVVAAYSIVADGDLNVFLVGNTTATDFPTTAGAYQTIYAGGLELGDGFVAKFDKAGVLAYATYIGGAANDYASGVALYGDGFAVISGGTLSADFPTTPGAFSTTNTAGDPLGFVAKLSPMGDDLVYSTFLFAHPTYDGKPWLLYGGNDVAVDGSGNAYVTGATRSAAILTTPGAFQPTYGGAGDAYVTKVNATGSGLVYATYLGGSGLDYTTRIHLDTSGNAYLAGITQSTDFPARSAAQPSNGGQQDAFVAKLNADGTDLVYSTYLGGPGTDDSEGIALDAAGNAYVSGYTSLGFPVTPGAFQTSLPGATAAAYVAKLDPAGALAYATYLGGSTGVAQDCPGTFGASIAVDAGGNACLTGCTGNTDFPTTSDALQATYGGGASDAFVTVLNPSGSALVYSTYLGGSGSDTGYGVALDYLGNIHVAGRSDSTDFPAPQVALRIEPAAIGPATTQTRPPRFVATFAGILAPSLSINDRTVTEGNSGSVNLGFTVTLSQPSLSTITVAYATADDSATAGSDYAAASGTLTFAPGETSKGLTVGVFGDTLDEPDETFFVNLTGPTSATIARGVGTIIDDDAPPAVSINDRSVTEGSSGSLSVGFTVSLSAASAQTVTVAYATANGSAISGSDYTAQSGALTFSPGQTSKTITVPVLGDTAVEPDETFLINLSSPVNATIADGQGIGIILNDDLTAENVVWMNLVGVSATGNSLSKTAGTAWGNAGAVSSKFIASGDGYVEFTATETNNYRMAGLANGDASQHYTDIEYAIYSRADGSIYVYESGAFRGKFGNYAAGDRFRVGVESGVVKYRKNGAVFYTSAVAPSYPLLLDTALYTTGATVTGATIAGNLQENVTWTSLVGVAAMGNSLTKTAGTAWGNAGAVSTNAIASGDGYVEFTATETNTYRMAGLGNGDASQNYADIEYAIYLRGDGIVRVYESGTSRGSFGSYAAGDRFRVGVESGVVKYRKNGTAFYTSTVVPSYPLLLDTALYDTGATVTNASIAGNLQENVNWTDAVGVSATGNSLGKTAGTAWGNAGAVSTKAIASGDGYVEFTATETNTYRMAGLGNGDASQNYPDIEYAIYLRGDGIVQVEESGTSRGSFGSYAAGDRFRVAVESGVVKYRKNGTVIYTSAVVPSYPLLLDTALYTTGATVTGARISGNLQENVTWASVVGVSASANNLSKMAGTAWGNAGAVSTKAIASGDGYVEFTAMETNTARMAGLSNGDASQNYSEIKYAIYTRADAIIQVFESGTSRGGFGSYRAGDRFRVGVESGVVKYRRNGTVFYTSAVAPIYPLLLDTALYTTGATVANATLSGSLQVVNLQENVTWTSLVGVSASANSLGKTGTTTGWNAGAVSTKSIASGDGYVEFTATETNTYRMCGLGNGNASASYTDIEYAIYPRADGNVWVYEAGTSRGNFGPYAAGDRLRVSIESGVVRYRKNGTVFYTSTVAPTYPLLVDTSLYTTGATVSNVVLSGGTP